MELIRDTFVLVAPDCPAPVGTMPKVRGSSPTVAGLQHELLVGQPYTLTLEELMVAVHIRRAGLSPAEAEANATEIQALLFGKPYPCMRASPLPKTYGWGVHHDADGRIALFGVESAEYRRLAGGGHGLKVVTAMRNKRA